MCGGGDHSDAAKSFLALLIKIQVERKTPARSSTSTSYCHCKTGRLLTTQGCPIKDSSSAEETSLSSPMCIGEGTDPELTRDRTTYCGSDREGSLRFGAGDGIPRDRGSSGGEIESPRLPRCMGWPLHVSPSPSRGLCGPAVSEGGPPVGMPRCGPC